MTIKITLEDGSEERVPLEVFRKVLNMSASRLRELEKEEGRLPPLENAAKVWVNTMQYKHVELI